MSNHVLRRVAIAPIRIYQQVISPLLPDACIYYPTCSQYAVQAIEKYGVLRGCWLAAVIPCTSAVMTLCPSGHSLSEENLHVGLDR
jgi:putative membrane protein insertion efficiency factor